MSSKKIKVIGVMSGTSLDGVDLVYVEFDKKEVTNFKILFSSTKSYNKRWKEKLYKGILNSKEELEKLDIEYGQFLGEEILNFIQKNKIKNIDFIASHGHTILHQPEKGITLQIGDGQTISDVTDQKVVCDFRSQDVLFGGQGAPLVPIGDEFLFSEFDSCLNLGGFANVSYGEKNKRVAFDVCPVNIVLNLYVQKLGFEYDDKGIIAASGVIDSNLLRKLNELPFYVKKHPKSLGLEWVQEFVFPIIDSYELEIKDVLRTFVEHIAIQIATSLIDKKNVLITGGGVFNTFLIDRIGFYTDTKIVIPNSKIINYKEALVFAFLGLLKVENQVNCLSSVTGAKCDHSSGVVFTPGKK
jgi:anhydro-N-acetylmuramic acid kinase